MVRARSVALFVAAQAGYAVSVAAFTPVAGQSAAAAVILPALVAGACWGARGGLVGAALTLPVSLVLFDPVIGVAPSLPNALPHVIGVLMTAAIGATVGHMRDLKHALRAQAGALAASEERYRKLVDHSPEGVVVLRHGVVVFGNPSMARALRVKDERELVGRTFVSFAPFEDREALDMGFLRVAGRARGPFTVEARLRTRDDEEIAVDLTALPVVHEGREATMVLVRDARLRAAAPALRSTADPPSQLVTKSRS